MENFGKFIAILLTMVINPIIRGYVFISLWGWFVVTTFNLNPLRLVEGIGLMFVFGYLTTKLNVDEKNDTSLVEKLLTHTISQIIYAVMILLFGYILVQFM